MSGRHPRDALRAEYEILAERYQQRFDKAPPPFPTGDLNHMANLNRWLVSEILNRPQMQVTVKKEPVVFPLKEPKEPDGA